jgi:hypothetical protein
MFLRGEGVPRNETAAFPLFQKAAAQGQTGAAIKLGYLYAAGKGTRKDPEAAYAWITAASLAGDLRGSELLHSLEKTLDAGQVMRAKRRAQSLRTPSTEQLAQALTP